MNQLLFPVASGDASGRSGLFHPRRARRTALISAAFLAGLICAGILPAAAQNIGIVPPEDFDEDELSTETRLLLQDEAAPSTEPITGVPIGVVPPRFAEGGDSATTGSAAQTGADTQPEDLLSGRFTADASEPPAPHVIDDMRQALLSAIAGYPDEIVVAVLEVAQDPERLAASEPGRVARPDPPINSRSTTLEVERAEVFEESFANLEEHPELLATLKKYPHATEALGEFTRENLSETWRIIDEERSEIPPEDAVAESAPDSEAAPAADAVSGPAQSETTR